MKVAVSSSGMDLEVQVDQRFGRCAYFIIIETDDMTYEAFDNKNISLSGGAGIQSASFVGSKGVKAVLTGKCGPKAMQALVAADIQVFTDHGGTVREAVEQYKQGGLASTTEANASQKSGVSGASMMGGGRGLGGSGRGLGMGGGKGVCGSGRGMGRRSSMQTADIKDTGALSKAEVLKHLKEEAAELRKQMDDIELKIKGVE